MRTFRIFSLRGSSFEPASAPVPFRPRWGMYHDWFLVVGEGSIVYAGVPNKIENILITLPSNEKPDKKVAIVILETYVTGSGAKRNPNFQPPINALKRKGVTFLASASTSKGSGGEEWHVTLMRIDIATKMALFFSQFSKDDVPDWDDSFLSV